MIQSHSSQHKIARLTGMSLGSVNMIITKDLRLKCLRRTKTQSVTAEKKLAQLNCRRHLLRRYPASMVNFAGLPTKNYLLSKLQGTLKVTVPTHQWVFAKRMLSHLACCELDQTLATHSWFLLVCLLLGKL